MQQQQQQQQQQQHDYQYIKLLRNDAVSLIVQDLGKWTAYRYSTNGKIQYTWQNQDVPTQTQKAHAILNVKLHHGEKLDVLNQNVRKTRIFPQIENLA